MCDSGNVKGGIVVKQQIMMEETVKSMAEEEALNQGVDKDEVNEARTELRRYADLTSVHGVGYIREASQRGIRLVWILIFLAFCVAAFLQLHGIVQRYLSYPFKTQLSLGFNALDFPSVTVCNVNPLRRSKLHLDPALQSFMHEMENIWGEEPLSELGRSRRRRRGIDNKTEDDIFGTFFDDYYAYEDSYSGDAYDEYEYEDYYGHGALSSEFKYDTYYEELIGNVSTETRARMGHQVWETILACRYNGRECSANDMSVSLDAEYGNCFTFNTAVKNNVSLRSRQAGDQHGLQLGLYTQFDQYLTGFTAGRGFRVSVHPFRTLPLPVQTGHWIQSGMSSTFEMRLMNVTRLGQPWRREGCANPNHMAQEYGVDYSHAACIAACTERTIANQCACMRREFTDFYPKSNRSLIRCAGKKHRDCTRKVVGQLAVGTTECNCRLPCSTYEYDIRKSYLSWPNEWMWNKLMDQVCIISEEGCLFLQEELQTESKSSILTANFALFEVFYSDLNYEHVEETSSYGPAQFGADVGGTVSLWLGLSFFSTIEIVELCIRLALVGFRRRRQNHGRVQREKACQDI